MREHRPYMRFVVMGGTCADARVLADAGNVQWALWRAGFEMRCGATDVSVWDLESDVVWTSDDGKQWNPEHLNRLLEPAPESGTFPMIS